MNLREIEAAFAHMGICPKCASGNGFWLGLRHNRACAQCKSCGSEFSLFKVYPITDPNRRSLRRIFLRK